MITKDGPLWLVVVSVATGASIGALIRWGLTYIFNGTQWFLSSPLGTVFSNLIAAYLMGAVLAWLSTRPDISPAVRLFIITGFLGALSTLTAVLGENLPNGLLRLSTSRFILAALFSLWCWGFSQFEATFNRQLKLEDNQSINFEKIVTNIFQPIEL